MQEECFDRLQTLPAHLTRSLARLGNPGQFPAVRRSELPWGELVRLPHEGWSARRLRSDLRPVAALRPVELARAG